MSHPTRPPVLFIPHGAPTFALAPGALGAQLAQLGTKLPPIAAVAVISPHWQTHDVRVMTTAAPSTLHDFGGFAAELYQLRYPAPGHPDLAMIAADYLREGGFAVVPDDA